MRDLLKNYLNDGETLAEVPEAKPLIEIPVQNAGKGVPLFASLPKAVESDEIRPMEQFDLGYGMIMYRTTLPASASGQQLKLNELHDIAQFFIDGKPLKTILDRRLNQNTVHLPEFDKAVRLDILVDNNGRVNYGEAIIDRKGITKSVEVIGADGTATPLRGWQVFRIPFDYKFMKAAAGKSAAGEGPVLYKTSIKLDAVGDTFLDMSKFGKGMVWVNGHNLGRYWKIGPQQTLYLPGCWLKKGDNEFLILDTMPADTPEFSGVKEPVLDQIQSDLSLKHRKPGQNLDLTGETPAIRGTLPNAAGWQVVKFDKPVKGRYICLEALSEQGGSTTMTSAAELIATDAEGRDLSRIKWSVVYADSEETDKENNSAENLIDQQESTFWHSEWSAKQMPLPHSVVIDMGEVREVGGFRILPRTDRNSNGRIRDFRFFVKEDPFKF